MSELLEGRLGTWPARTMRATGIGVVVLAALAGCGAINHLSVSKERGQFEFALCDPFKVNAVSVWAIGDDDRAREIWAAQGGDPTSAPLTFRLGVPPHGMEQTAPMRDIESTDRALQVYFETRGATGGAISAAWAEFAIDEVPADGWRSSTGTTRGSAC